MTVTTSECALARSLARRIPALFERRCGKGWVPLGFLHKAEEEQVDLRHTSGRLQFNHPALRLSALPICTDGWLEHIRAKVRLAVAMDALHAPPRSHWYL